MTGEKGEPAHRATAAEQALLQELLLGEFFALTALVLGALRIINLAHGEFLILGTFLGYYWLPWTGTDPLVGLVVVVPVVAGVGFVVQRWALSPPVRHATGRPYTCSSSGPRSAARFGRRECLSGLLRRPALGAPWLG
jgi:hypothetical protein